MSAANNISLQLNFNQVVEIVKQLPEGQRKKLLTLLEKDIAQPAEKKFSEKEIKFLEGLDESVAFINAYKPGQKATPSLTQILNEF